MQIQGKIIKHVYCVGIGGVGVGPVAAFLRHMGLKVSGADVHQNALTRQLEQVGVRVFDGHHAAQVQDADLLVYSSAVNENNPERLWARKHGVLQLHRAEMLAHLLHLHRGIAVAGTHGKTTTTAMIAHLLMAIDADPSYVVGGKMQNTNRYMRCGGGDLMVAEVDESDGSLLHFTPNVAIMNNVEADHLRNFDHDFSKLKATFLGFLNQVACDGFVVVNRDDPVAWSLTQSLNCQVVSVGRHLQADYRLLGFEQHGLSSRFDLVVNGDLTIDITLPMPGKHNAFNAAMALACVHRLGGLWPVMAAAIARFKGVGRRFSVCDDYQFDTSKVTLINDYGHHPTELAVTLDAARSAYPNRRLVMAFEPHRFSRTQALLGEFIEVLLRVDCLLLLDTHAAGELSVAGVSSDQLYEHLRGRGMRDVVRTGQLSALYASLSKYVRDDDVVILQGAGGIGYLPKSW